MSTCMQEFKYHMPNSGTNIKEFQRDVQKDDASQETATVLEES